MDQSQYEPNAVADADPAAGSKRPLDAAAEDYPQYGDAKRHQTSYPEQEAVFRLVLNVADTALIIGRGGSTVRQIEQEFGARVKRLQEPPGAREQVVIVWSKPAALAEGELVPAQKALLDCVRRVVTQDNPREASGAAPTVKLLVNRSQEAALGGDASERLRSEMGITVHVTRGDNVPACALDNDILVELSGDRYQLLNAVELVSGAVLAVPPTEKPGGASAALKDLAGRR